MPEQENITTENIPVETSSAETPVESTTPISPDTTLTTDVSAFERLSGVKLGEDKTTTEVAPVVKSKPEESKEGEETKVTEDKQVVEQTKQPEVKSPVKVVDTRDFTGLTKEEIEVAKKMSVSSFVAYKSLVVDHKKLKDEKIELDNKVKQLQEGKEILPANYYDNPDAVIFSPVYRSTAKNVELSNLVVNHWEQQLMRIEEGLANPEAKQTWVDLENDPKTGELRLGSERPVGLRDKVQVMRYLAQAEQQVGTYKQRLDTIVASFKGENEKITSKIKQAEKEFFPAYETPDDNTKKTMEQAREAIRNAGISETNPSFSPLVKSITLNMQMVDFIKTKDKEIEELKKKMNIKESINKDRAKAGPSSSNLSSGSTNGNDNSTLIPSWDEFKSRLAV